MDVKGITWVGNVYEKFEAMCLEVEEIMYQDTVKYVENQVQTVGASVKRFYSDVMQDLLPPTSVDSEKVSPCGFTVEQDSGEGINRKPNVRKKEEPAKADDQSTRAVKVTPDNGKDVGLAPLINVRSDQDNSCGPSRECLKGACSNLPLRQHQDESTYNSSNVAVNETQSQAKLMPTEESCVISPEKYLSGGSTSCCEFVNEIHEASGDEKASMTTPSMNEGTRSDSNREDCDEIENASEYIAALPNDCQSSNEIILLNSVQNNVDDMGVPFYGGISAKSNAADNNCANEDVYVSHQGKLFGWNFDATESKTATEHGTVTIPQSDKMKLEETCVLVNENEIHFLPQPEGKWRPYKKKIREALYSRMRSSRKQEYEQLARYGDDKNLNQEYGESLTTTLVVDETKKLPHHGSCESEWELL
ncbi:hypothetical protein PanWU01x14_336910 [Parasponia andersonii]|uniref:Uncharacterized protein n=1 Tax=Parasponia andersonii TaxID=3476 RepID=A0A2P5AFP6_PARAD|nr:hypothetical protein PanWU01x14_336910 [Parasponia andersonii]